MTRVSYEEGLALGHEYADADRLAGAAFASEVETLRAEAREARVDMSRSWVAFKLGIVRGYRDAVRTLRDGRYGT